MGHDQQHDGLGEIAACTVTAAHRRDHDHEATDQCHPHSVEVVHLGARAVMVCHDCRADSGFLAHRDAEHLALEHRQHTRTDAATRPPGRDEHAA